MRTIKIVLPGASTPVEVQSEATTWGGLKADLDAANVDYHNKKAVENVNRTSFVSDDSVLPEGDFGLFFFPEKVESGAGYEEMLFGELRRIHNELGLPSLGSNPTKAQLVLALNAYNYGKNDADGISVSEEEIKNVIEALKETTDYLESVIKASSGISEADSDLMAQYNSMS
jgi:hypothetical protein